MISDRDGGLSLRELPCIVVDLLERARQPLLSGVDGRLGLFVRYLRRKPGRGLTVIFDASRLAARRAAPRSSPASCRSPALGQPAPGGARVALAPRQAPAAQV